MEKTKDKFTSIREEEINQTEGVQMIDHLLNDIRYDKEKKEDLRRLRNGKDHIQQGEM